MKVLLITQLALLLICGYSLGQLTCPTCFAKSQCFTAVCNTTSGNCVQQLINPLPVDCCRATGDCRRGDCIFGSCNIESNQCNYIDTCAGDGVSVTNKTCISDGQCATANQCILSKCIDNMCINSPLTNPDNGICCQKSTDCVDKVCFDKYCDANTFQCVYKEIPGCVISEESYIETNSFSSTTSSSSSSSSIDLYAIPDSYGAGDIVFLVIGCVILLFVVLVFIYFAFKTIYDKIFHKDKEEEDQHEKAAADGGGH